MTEPLPRAIQASLDILGAHGRLRGDSPPERSMEETIRTVITVFDELGVAWCLVGAHAVGQYTEPRATRDFDFIVDDKKLKRLLARLEEALGPLDALDIDAAVRLRAIDVDLIRASTNQLFAEALRETRPLGAWRIPSPEAVIALKFLSSTSQWRHRDRRAQDALDLVRVYRAAEESLDRDRLRQLAALVYPGADRELDELLRKVDAGESIAI